MNPGDGGAAGQRPPSVDALARSLADIGLPHPLLVEVVRGSVADGTWSTAREQAERLARSLLQPVINATGVLLHTNLGRAPLSVDTSGRAVNLEFDLDTGRRGSRQDSVGSLLARLCGAEAAIVVNNNAAAVVLVMAALAEGREVPVARGESVEIGGGFRVPEVMEQSGARLVDVGTTNRTRLDDYRRAVGAHTALILKVHPSNYRVEGFVEDTPVAELSTLGVPVVADIGSGLLDAACPWMHGGPPAWLHDEPAARQSIEAGAALITFSTDKLLGGPQAGVIAGRADLVARCAAHPLMRALRPGALVLSSLQDVLLAYLRRDVTTTVPFWRMVARSVASLEQRARDLGVGIPTAMEALPGAGSLPGITMPSFGVSLPGDHAATLRNFRIPIIARVREQVTHLDLRTVEPSDDVLVAEALRGC
jgi:L-seryl-tRNA(Ser) seleniumtransferase